MSKLRLASLMGGISLAIAFTLSCSSDDGGGGDSSSGSDVSSSSGGSSSDEPSSSSEEQSSSSSVPSSSSYVGPTPGNPVSYGNETYQTVVIGDQVWFARNLNYAAEGSKCYDNDPANCNIYGRLYNWATAMDLPSSCNSTSCSSQIQSPHHGICPLGWHIPSDDDWDILIDYADYEGSSLEAGAKLKATEGWKDFSGLPSGNGTDEFGFSALPGGLGFGSGSFSGIGLDGSWWIASDNNDIAYTKGITYLWGSVLSGISDKPNLKSIRCLKDQPSSSSAIPSSSSLGGSYTGSYGSLPYEGQTYKTVVIGTQTWMAENLNYAADDSKCYGDNSGGDSQNRCGTYGRLYTWATANTVCPSGWHLPTIEDWEIMTNHIGGSSTEGKKLKATSGWNEYQEKSGNGTDEYGFLALPGGGYKLSNGRFDDVGNEGSWWSASENENNSNYANYRSMSFSYDFANWVNSLKSSLFSVRCLQD